MDYSTDFYALLFLATPRDKHPEKFMWPEYYKHIASPQKYTTDVVSQFPEGVRMPPQKYEAIPVPVKDTWGVLMRKDSPLAEKENICPEDLWDKPLIVSHQKGDDVYLNQWLQRKESELHIVATYNLLFNASLLVDEGLGYALCYDKLINTQGSSLCFRPFSPRLEARGFIIWKKYQVFSKAAKYFLQCLNEMIEEKA